MPNKVNPVWATVEAAQVMLELYKRAEARRRELERTPAHSTVQRQRLRDLRRAERLRDDVYWAVGCGLAFKVRNNYPKASPAQVFMQIKEELRLMLTAAFADSS